VRLAARSSQNLCTVCPVSADNVSELCATDAEVVALDAHTLTEIEERAQRARHATTTWTGDPR
jgi:hypothetical protein